MVSDSTWEALRHKAATACATAYAPYSDHPVGAAGMTDEGRLVSGCNVENVSYGLGVCAEVALVTDLFRGGGGRLSAVSVTNRAGDVIMPCGRCRQVLLEHGGVELLVDHPHGPRRLGDLLPDAFGPDDLAAGRA
ncbi:MAG: cytidine deaminase [Gordonia paraffinivorans]